jgi:hypothetical protein
MAYLLDSIPIGLLSVLTFLMTLASFEGGFRIGRRGKREGDAPLGTLVGAGLGLLAFFLAFTFGIAASRFEVRRQLVLDEANAIGTAHLRAALVPEPHRTEIQSLLREYIDRRIQGVQSGMLEEALTRSEELHRQLWREVVALGEADPHSIVAGLLIESINEVIDLHQKRVTAGLRSRIPERVWDVLFLLTVVSMLASGYQAGHAPGRSPAVVLLALAFSSVILVIADLDRPQEGSLHVSQQALIDTRESMDR